MNPKITTTTISSLFYFTKIRSGTLITTNKESEYEIKTKSYDILVDFKDYKMNKDIVDGIIFDENDNQTAIIKAKLVMDGEAIDLIPYISITIDIVTADGRKIKNECEVLNQEEGLIKIKLSKQSLLTLGYSKFKISLSDAKSTLVSPLYYYRVDEAIINEYDIKASDEYNFLTLLISKSEKVLDDTRIINDKIIDLEDMLKESELIRNDQENSREIAEKNRESNEHIRREAFEIIRVNSEEYRRNNEERRQENESIREEQNTFRTETENIRIANELNRQEFENQIQEIEDDRINSENIRISNELQRQNEEIIRAKQEDIRIELEKERNDDELQRCSNEILRKQQEDDREQSIVSKFVEVDTELEKRFINIKSDVDKVIDTKVSQVNDKILEIEDEKDKMKEEVNIAVINGVKGDQGYTPYIGENGNWFINGVDTEKPSKLPLVWNKISGIPPEINFTSKITKLNSSNSITEILDNDTKILTIFQSDGSILEERYVKENLVGVSKITFNNNEIQESKREELISNELGKNIQS